MQEEGRGEKEVPWTLRIGGGRELEAAQNIKEATKYGCSSLEEFKVQREELKALKEECRRMWQEQEKGEEECRTMWKEVYTNFMEKWKAEKKDADPDAMQV